MRLPLIVLFLLSFMPFAGQAKPVIVGWVEKVHIDALDTVFKAKLDTGATTSSIDATIIKLVEPADNAKDDDHGKVIFSITDDSGKKRILERKVKRYVRIKKKLGGWIRRPVVTMAFCVAGQKIVDEVNLADRENFIYPVLIGRNMMREGKFVIDASKTFTSEAKCDTPDA
jgi:hypothetical protein